jgi:hypothetical protein
MPEREWLNCTDPQAMLHLILGGLWLKPPLKWLNRRRAATTQRRLRLFLCACCRLMWEWMPPRSRTAVEVAEGYAYGLRTKQELRFARRDASAEATYDRSWWGQIRETLAYGDWADLEDPNLQLAVLAASEGLGVNVMEAIQHAYGLHPERDQRCSQLLRDLFNPFHSGSINPAWLTWSGGTTAALVRTIFEECRWDDLPVLADALEEAGCADESILSHCRGSGPHVRGCWVLDLLLGKD